MKIGTAYGRASLSRLCAIFQSVGKRTTSSNGGSNMHSV